MWFNYNMKNFKIIQMLPHTLILSALLVSCGGQTVNENAFLVPKIVTKTVTTENYYIPIDRTLMESFINGKRSFIFLLGHYQCSACNALKPLVQKYVQDTKTEIYYLDSSTAEYSENFEFFVDELDLTRTPTLLLFSEGVEVKRMVGISELRNQKQVNNFFNSYIKTASYFVLNEETTINAAKYVTFTYDFYDETAQNIINTHFYPLFSNQDVLVYLEDSSDTPLYLTYDTDTDNKIALDNDAEALLNEVSAFAGYFNGLLD